MKRSTIRNLGRWMPGSVRELAKRYLSRRSIDPVNINFVLEESASADHLSNRRYHFIFRPSRL